MMRISPKALAERAFVLRPGRDRRIRRGHRWVFSNELVRRPQAAPGDLIPLYTAEGDFLGRAFFHPQSLIAGRLFVDGDEAESSVEVADLLRRRLVDAYRRRERLFPGESVWRLCYGESDGLPGLVIDRYGDVMVVQVTALALDRYRDEIARILLEEWSPRAVVERSSSPLRQLEGLEPRVGLLAGAIEGPLEVRVAGLWQRVDPLGGQKTGLFLDQRVNRRLTAELAPGRSVLDCFCYQGEFGLAAVAAGATSVVGIDQSAAALDRATWSARRQGLEDRCSFRRASPFNELPRLVRQGAAFDLIILDPPTFTQTRRHVARAKKAYRELNTGALRLLAPGGVLATASCSHHIRPDTFEEILRASAAAVGRPVRILARGTPSPDHPELLGMPETHYLDFLLLEVTS